MAALYFDKLVILDPVGASWNTIGADHHSRETDHYMHRLSVHVLAKSETGEMFYVLSYQ